jgi:phosphoadenosine phosphosulfate reductase
VKLWNDTLEQLNTWAGESSSVLVAFSGGKDSLAILDLCCRSFKEVQGFFMYYVPGLQIMEDRIKAAEDRWQIPIFQVPHFEFIYALRHGLYRDESDLTRSLPDFKVKDIYSWALGMTGLPFLATGARASDGIQRRQFFENVERQAKKGDKVWGSLIYPIQDWKKRDVVQYLKVHDIPVPELNPGKTTSGVGLNPNFILWLAKEHPKDYERMRKWFPYLGAILERKRLFDIP